jgi:hypothetical protein
MRRHPMVLAVAAVLLASTVAGTALTGTAVASAAPIDGPAQVNTFTGTSVFFILTPGCNFAHQTFDATYGNGRHPGSFQVDGCVTSPIPPFATPAVARPSAGDSFRFDGTFTLTAPDQRHITGSVTGTIADSSSTACSSGRLPAALDLVMTPTTGTRRVSGAPRPFTLTGLWCSSGTSGAVDPISGTLALSPLAP